MSNNNFQQILKPCINYNRIMGYFPYELKTLNGQPTIKYNKWKMLLNMIIFVIMYSILLPLIYFTYNSHPKFSSRLQYFAHVISMFTNLFCSWFICIFQHSTFRYDKLIYEGFCSINKHLNGLKINVPVQKLKLQSTVKVTAEILVSFVYSFVLSTGLVWDNWKLKLYYLIAVYAVIAYTIANHLTSSVSFVNCITMVGYCFTIVNENFNKNILLQGKTSTVELIIKTSKFHQILCQLLRLINKKFTFQFLVLFTLMFVNFTSNVIFVIRSILDRTVTLYVAVCAVWIVACGFKVVYWVHVSSSCTKKVSFKLFKLINCINSVFYTQT